MGEEGDGNCVQTIRLPFLALIFDCAPDVFDDSVSTLASLGAKV